MLNSFFMIFNTRVQTIDRCLLVIIKNKPQFFFSHMKRDNPSYRLSMNTYHSDYYRQSLASDLPLGYNLYQSSETSIRGRNTMNFQNAQKMLDEIEKVQKQRVASSYSNLQCSLSQIQEKIRKAKTSLTKQKITQNVLQIEDEQQKKIKRNNKTLKKNQETSTISSLNEKEISQKLTLKTRKYKIQHTYYIESLSHALSGNNQRAFDHLSMSMNVFKNLMNIRSPSFACVHQRRIHLPRSIEDKDKMTLILDLDQTLIHCQQNPSLPFDTILPIETASGAIAQAFIGIRPYAISFLKKMAKYFQIIAFTASHQSYADVVLNQLDPNQEYIKHRLYRRDCYQVYENLLVKDLRVIDRDLSKMVLVDNAPYSYIFQPENGIPILPYFSGEPDNELYKLQKYLMSLLKCNDVRESNKQTFKFHHYRNYSDQKQLVQNLYLKSN